MNCELCGQEIKDGNFGDVDGAIVCPVCMGHTDAPPAPEVVQFNRKHGMPEEYDDTPIDRSRLLSGRGASKTDRRRRRAGVTHPRWRLWMMAVSEAKEKGPSRLTKSLNYWSNSINRTKKGNYDEVLIGILNDVGTYLNRYTSEIGDYRIAIPVVAKMFNLSPSIIRTIFFEKGALAQTLLQFDIDTSKQGHADSLLRAVEEYQSAGSEFNVTKQAVLDMAKSMRTKDPSHKKTMLSIINGANDYDKLRGGLMHAKLSFEGMGAELPVAGSKHATITIMLPWKFKNTIRAAQTAAKLGKVRVQGSTQGCSVSGTIHRLSDLGIVKQTDANKLMGPIRTAGAQTLEGRTWNLPNGVQGVELMTRMSSRLARALGRQLVAKRDLLFAIIYDDHGTPHTMTREAATKPPAKRIYMDQVRETPYPIRPRKAALTSALQEVWEELAPELGEALETDDFDAPMLHEFIGDNASNYLEGAALKEWLELDAEGQTNALAEAFPNDHNSVMEVQQKHLDNRTRGAARREANCGCDHQDPTDLLEEDDNFSSPLQEMILEAPQHQEDPGYLIIELP